MPDLKFPQINSLIISGRLTTEPEVKSVGQDSKDVCNASIATDDGWGEKKRPIFLDCTFWGKTAEIAGELKKGSPVVLEGRIHMEEWKDKDTGTRRNKIVMIVNRIHGLAWPDKSGTEQSKASSGSRPF